MDLDDQLLRYVLQQRYVVGDRVLAVVVVEERVRNHRLRRVVEQQRALLLGQR